MSVGSGYGKHLANEKGGKGRKTSDHGPDFRFAYRILKIHRLLIIAVALFSAGVAILQHASKSQYYIATSKLTMIQKEKVSPMNLLAGNSGVDDFMTKAPTLIELFQTREACIEVAEDLVRTNAEVVIRMMARVPSFQLQAQMDAQAKSQIANTACGTVWFQPDYDKLMLQVHSRSPDPFVAATVANVVGRKLIEFDQRRMVQKLSELKKFLAEQEAELGGKLKELETQRAEFQSKTNLISVQNAQSNFYENQGRAEQMYFDVEMRLKTNESLIASTEKSIEQVRQLMTNSADGGSNLYLSQVQYRLNMLQYRKAMLSNKEGAEAQSIDTEIQEIMKSYKAALDTKAGGQFISNTSPLDYFRSLQENLKILNRDRQELRLQYENLSVNLKRREGDTQKLARNIQRLGEIERSIDTTSSLYVVIKKRLQEAEIEEAATVSEFQMLREATPPSQTENIPLARKLLFTVGVGLFAVIAFLLVRETMLPTVKSLSDMEHEGMTAVGHIPIAETSPFKSPPLLLADSPNSFEADAFRALRVRVTSVADYLIGQKKGAKVLMVTSPRPYCGKTFVSCNLAMALAKSGKRTLLIDLDLRRPSCKEYFPKIKFQGFEDLEEKHDIAKVKKSFADNLDVLLNSKPSEAPAELLEKIKLEELVEAQRGNYDYIILDMPPTLAVIDPFMVIQEADLVLMVAEHRRTHKEDLSHSMRMLTEIKNIPVLGLLNMVHPEMLSADGSRYYIIVSSPKDRQKTEEAS